MVPRGFFMLNGIRQIFKITRYDGRKQIQYLTHAFWTKEL